MHEKLGLLPFLNERVAKVSSSNSVPVDPIQVVQIFIEPRISGSGISVREGPTHPLPLGPVYDFVEISHQMYNRALAANVV